MCLLVLQQNSIREQFSQQSFFVSRCKRKWNVHSCQTTSNDMGKHLLYLKIKSLIGVTCFTF
ncbi:unnamed protein product [Linum tenue]|uniref:Uncharacterized protein n=1 Tax=Linum tenue TaxID=586396 RepID=A0AAV0K8I6_9ROSI|nr:unnamed protein product [Linum tenue]